VTEGLDGMGDSWMTGLTGTGGFSVCAGGRDGMEGLG